MKSTLEHGEKTMSSNTTQTVAKSFAIVASLFLSVACSAAPEPEPSPSPAPVVDPNKAITPESVPSDCARCTKEGMGCQVVGFGHTKHVECVAPGE